MRVTQALRARFDRSEAESPWDTDELIRAELFSVERLEQHAASLAAEQPVAARPSTRRSLAKRLRDNEVVLLGAYRRMAGTLGEDRQGTPAADWLLDNFHIVEEQIREIREDLPPSFYRVLPKLAQGPLKGYPRVFGVAWAFIAHTDSRFDPEALRRFVRSYQQVQPLTIGELWAVAITLRIVLVENLRRAAARILGNRTARQDADGVADQLLGTNGATVDLGALVHWAKSAPAMRPAFIVQLVQRLRDQDPKVTPALAWLEARLSGQGQNTEQLVRDEHQKQGASNVTVRNIITSMRLLSDLDWATFFESVSLVDERLRAGSAFAAMDFATRNLYRTAIEELARGAKRGELEIAEAALHSSARAAPALRAGDPGYHLIGAGRAAFEGAIGYRGRIWTWPRRFNVANGPGRYILAILLLGGLLEAWPLWILRHYGVHGWPEWLLGALGYIPALDAAVALVNRTVTGGFGASRLPSLALRTGVPMEYRTLIAVPCLLTTPAAVQLQIERLEVHHLAAPDEELYFALVSDWRDAPTESFAADDELLNLADAGIAELNTRYAAAAGGKRFLLLHRRRVWSDVQRVWMGWERKRGKLHELNRLLRGALDTTFIAINGLEPCVPPAVRYVITLDADTRLPRGSARRLVGKMAHPLNRPSFDHASGQVLDGYAVLQPRVAPSLPMGHEGSRFQSVFSSTSGIDPYAAAVSDVYQDLFGEGSYAGKGIYDVDAFEAALAGRVPDGSLLSHDLFEGIFARAGLVSDIQVVEEFPARYDVAAARQHRWARGDWQLLPWILGRRDASAETRGRARLPLIGLWKMLDNLRRTLSAPASVAALLCCWSFVRGAALPWSAFILLTIMVPAWLPVLTGIVPHRVGITARSHLYALRKDIKLALWLSAFLVTFLAHQAWLMLDAIARTLFRLWVTGRNLLQWTTAAQAGSGSRLGLGGAYWKMSGAIVVAAAAVALLHGAPVLVYWVSTPWIALWLVSPAMAVWISVAPRTSPRLTITVQDAMTLRRVGRRTWRYFETFVTAAEHWLPPDNFQEDPAGVLAHRTSPTNIGLYLLAAVSARDLGWIGTAEAVARLEATLATLRAMERFRGHLYNWYDTRDLRPLEPRYVSTVDSGNLAAHLLTLANACKEWRTEQRGAPEGLAGALDALELAHEALRRLPDDQRTHHFSRDQLQGAGTTLRSALEAGDLQRTVMTAATFLDVARGLSSELGAPVGADILFWAEAVQRTLIGAAVDVAPTQGAVLQLQARLTYLETEARAQACAMEFDFLLDRERRLLSVGFRAAEGALDSSCYDLLASEARLASFLAIAKNDVPPQHWFRLGRAVTAIGNGAALISWSGSMFEYLMPSLVLRAPEGSLLEQTNRLIVRRQVSYGAELGLPWGMSESAYNARDLELTYQYSNFGVPGLGLKRGLSDNQVIAPYASALAAMIDPTAAVANLSRLTALGALGQFGFYEAVDYTRSRVPEGSRSVLVRAFMAHHQGMTLVAIANVLQGGRMRERFHAEPMVQATELLLQERTPRDVSVSLPRAEQLRGDAHRGETAHPPVRRLTSPHDATPQVHLLSNARYAVMLTGAASGYSRWGDLAVTRWREDATRDDTGSYVFLRDVESGLVWSAGYQPSGVEPERFEVNFSEDRAEYLRVDATLITSMEVVVSPEDDAEVRRVSITNTGTRTRDIDFTSYAELVLAPPATDLAHQAFAKLFVQTEYVESVGALLATRRRRTAEEPEMWVAHHAVVEGESIRKIEFETDRARFIGRGRELRDAIAVWDGRRLSNTVGTVLDPVFSLRQRVRVPAGGTVRVAYWTVAAASRDQVLALLDKHHEANAFVRAGTLAWTQAQVQLRHLGVDAAEAGLFQRLAGHVLLANGAMRPSSETIGRGAGTPALLWAQGISGDLPIVLLRIDDVEDIEIARELLRAQEYWRLKRLSVDVVILNERVASYMQDLQIALETQLRMSQSRPRLGGEPGRGAVYILRADLISDRTRGLLNSIARVVLVARRGSLADQLDQHREAVGEAPREAVLELPPPPAEVPTPPAGLEYFNGLGGFAAEGREYLILLGSGQSTPMPWINVIANASFGFQVAAEGSGYTWAQNSREHQLTPWSNDPVTDRPGEALYVRDEESGELWGPTASPIREAHSTYTARHGQGYSRFECRSHGIALDLVMYVPMTDSIKISRLILRNESRRTRRLSVTTYVEWVLGASRAAAAPFIVSATDTLTGALLAHNPWSLTAGTRVAFADLRGRQTSWTCDRREFIGRHGTLSRPAALVGFQPLSKRVGSGLDPCAALQTEITLEPDESIEIASFLGEALDLSAAQALISRYRQIDLEAVLQSTHKYWEDTLTRVQVKTPDRSVDIMLNRWLLYQALACRLWARAAFYQASGAYGFRDQLQDCMALVLARPDLARQHLLRAAGRQFVAGDVQHWWLPETGQGVRTLISDDRVWLGFVTAHFVKVSGDLGVLDERVAFLDGPALRSGEQDAYFAPTPADESATLYEHCARALDQSLRVGVHGLPLIGTGDWNDGLNRVGQGGRGESIWLGWFLYATLLRFGSLAKARHDEARFERWNHCAEALGAALETAGWDGQWYRRAYYDDGTILGSAASGECRIDAIAQSWAVLSGAAPQERARLAMEAVTTQLIRLDVGLAVLFAPPFEHSELDPGYVKAYPPGIRENGGQYTHAAVWSVMAYAALGQGEASAALYAMLNPINRSRTRADVHRYKVEPYVVAADVYSEAPHVGRGGWTWYTGSAAWMYRAGVESILGLQVQGASLRLTPCLPAHWPRAQVSYKYGAAHYDVLIDNTQGDGCTVAVVEVDGIALASAATAIALADDALVHRVVVRLGGTPLLCTVPHRQVGGDLE